MPCFDSLNYSTDFYFLYESGGRKNDEEEEEEEEDEEDNEGKNELR